jgi:hypothetical protein
MNRNDVSPAAPPSYGFDRYGYQKFNPAEMPVAGRSSDIRASVGDMLS